MFRLGEHCVFGIVNVGENFADAIWDNVFAVARVCGICRPLFDSYAFFPPWVQNNLGHPQLLCF